MLLENIESLISSIESNIYIGNYPDTPNSLCTITQIPGRPSVHVFGQQQAAIRQPSIQVRIRDASYNSGQARCEAIVAVLDGLPKTAFATGVTILNMFLDSDIVPMGKDTKDRSEFIMIYKIMTE